MATRPDLGERAVLAAMRAWRRGTGPLAPWFRATPFAAAHHYRGDRPAGAPGPMPAAIARAVAAWPRPDPASLWIFDLPAPVALWLAFALRRRFGLAAALCFNGWYDPRGLLDGRREIPLLLGLAPRLGRTRPAAGACLVFDAGRRREVAAEEAADRLDNRYDLGEEDAPSAAQVRAAGIRRVRAHTWGDPAGDLAPYLEHLGRELPVDVQGDRRRTLDLEPVAAVSHG